MTEAMQLPFLTPQEYLRREREAECKSEYLKGQVFAMAGASTPHNMISMTTAIELSSRTVKRIRSRCRVMGSDQRVHVPSTGYFTYPDVVVVCGKPLFVDGESDTITNPVVIVEVLSPSTRTHDRTTKRRNYQEIATLRGYLLLEQDRQEATLYARVSAEGDWVETVYTAPDAVIPLPSIGCELPLAALYANLDYMDDDEEETEGETA